MIAAAAAAGGRDATDEADVELKVEMLCDLKSIVSKLCVIMVLILCCYCAGIVKVLLMQCDVISAL